MKRSLLCLPLLVAALGIGCGSDDSTAGSTPAVADSPAGAKIEADSAEGREMALDVQDYFMRNCARPGALRRLPAKERKDPRLAPYRRWIRGAEAMCGQMASIAVDGTRVTIRSDIPDQVKRAAGESFCQLMLSSDVADYTPGHELQDIDGETVAVCPGESP